MSRVCEVVSNLPLLIKIYEHFVFMEGVIEWPSEDEAPPEDARDLVTRLLEQDPIVRLGTTGVWTSGLYLCACKILDT